MTTPYNKKDSGLRCESMPLTGVAAESVGLALSEGGSLVPARRAVVVRDGQLRPLAEYCHDAASDVTTLYAAPPDADDGGSVTLWTERGGLWTERWTLPGAVHCALAVAAGFIVAADAGICRLDYDAADLSWTLVDMNPAPPSVWFGAVDTAHVSESVGSVTLRNVTQAAVGHDIPVAEMQRLTDALTDAYSRLIHSASAAGGWVQPVVVRYRIYASQRRLLYLSAPLLVAPHGLQCRASIEAPVSIDSTTYTVGPLSVEAQSWQLQLHLPSDANFQSWLQIAEEIEVSVTPQFHPLMQGELCSCRFSHTATSHPVAVVLLPGSEYTDARYSAEIARLLPVTDATTSVVLRLRDLSPGTTLTLRPAAPELPSESLKLREKALAAVARSAVVTSELALYSPPNSFRARRVIADGDVVVWGDVTPVVSRGFSLREIVASTSPQPWLGTLRVTLADGSMLGAAIGGSSDMPLSFGPLVSYPHEDAVALDIYVDDLQGEVTHARFPLTSVAGGGFASWISTDFAPKSTESFSGTLPSPPASAGESQAGTLLSATLADPLLPLSVMRCSTGRVLSLLPASGARSSFNSARGRLYAFCADGIFTVALDSRCRLLSASCIDRRAIASPLAAVATSRGVMALLGGRLCRIKGAGVDTLCPASQAGEIGWEQRADELWLLLRDGTVSALRPDDLGSRRHVVSPEPPVHLHTLRSRLLLEAERGVLAVADAASAANYLRWHGSVMVHGRWRCRAVEIGIAASHLSGYVRIATHHGAGPAHAVPVVTLGVSGAVNSPLRASFIAPPARYITVEIEATASPDFTLSHILLTLK